MKARKFKELALLETKFLENFSTSNVKTQNSRQFCVILVASASQKGSVETYFVYVISFSSYNVYAVLTVQLKLRNY